MLGRILVFVILAAVLYNLGAGLYYMISDRGTTDRTVRALTWRVALSVLLIIVVIIGIRLGLFHPHGVAG